MEYRISLAARPHLNLWGRSGWRTASGGGRLEGVYNTTHSGLTLGIFEDRNVAYSRYNLAGGVAVDLSF
jgi:hypothetical protein